MDIIPGGYRLSLKTGFRQAGRCFIAGCDQYLVPASLGERKQLLEAIRYVDLVIPEESWAQKKSDVHEYHVDTFVIGDDWEGKFDFLEEEGCEVVYLSRTPEISSSQMKEDLGRAGGVGASGRDYTGVDLSQ